ncbi:TPA: hypothetical protein ACMX9M_000116 [Klebsiella variicola]|nr:hypothetical protein [Klebsiella variicola]HCB1084130.1 hypothetical protein [Klebsiella variicola subsp. variicola]EKZ6228660.1 hypothetical protein [Klebsiella variicola]ELA1953568.1 hypothetical protein [Klebsiella variicola]HCB9328318.1 hypothetical protein [Klebsiella variicola]HDK6722214.1 hypothetical protein [Klebsiella variicola]
MTAGRFPLSLVPVAGRRCACPAYRSFGEGDYARQEQVIQQLLQESKA